MSNKKGIWALSPLIVFITLYVVTSIVAGDFYKVPVTVAFMASSIYAIATCGGFPLAKRINLFSRGASSDNLMLMLWIYVLAGAFADSAKEMGSVDATVNCALRFLPSNMLLPGLFIAACFISLSIGTSVGTIVALVPIAATMAHTIGADIPLLTAIIVGGAYFGDNLSFISDTTVVATQTQGCKMSDKFKVNAFIVVPAAIAILLVYFYMGYGLNVPPLTKNVEYLKILPYLAVLITAIAGMNVMAVLTIGVILSGAIGIFVGSYNLIGWMEAMGQGIAGMGELVIIAMLAGGMLEIIRENGGIDYLISKLTSRVNSKRGAELSIAALVSMVNVCTANNTVAIITVSGIAKQLSEKFGIDPRRTASLLDTFSCIAQGIIPYGAQMLMASGLAKLSPVEILLYLYYPYALAAVTMASIVLRFPKRYTR